VNALSVQRYKNALFLPDSELWKFLKEAGTIEVFRFIYDTTL
jgi:hypothetical protein